MIKPPVPAVPHETAEAVVLAAGQHLAADIVDPRHILAAEPPEIVYQTAAGAGVLVVVLDEMTDVLDTMGAASGTDLFGIVFLHQPGHSIHIGHAHLGTCRRLKIPFP